MTPLESTANKKRNKRKRRQDRGIRRRRNTREHDPLARGTMREEEIETRRGIKEGEENTR